MAKNTNNTLRFIAEYLGSPLLGKAVTASTRNNNIESQIATITTGIYLMLCV